MEDEVLNQYFTKYPTLKLNIENSQSEKTLTNQQATHLLCHRVIDLENDHVANGVLAAAQRVIVIDSDDEDCENWKPSIQYQEIVLTKPSDQLLMNDVAVRDCVKSKGQRVEEVKKVRDCIKRKGQRVEEVKPSDEMEVKRDKGQYVGAEDDEGNHQLDTEDGEEGLDDIWKEMTMDLECSKDNSVDPSSDEQGKEVGEDCYHNYVLKDDLGYVCRVCGVIKRRIETIFEFQYNKVQRTRTYVYDSSNTKAKETTEIVRVKFSEDDLMVTEISAHPRHMKQMKPHQVEGFNFLCSNLVADNPGGCILAHAPGSGKTFMIISFMQSFLARFPRANPLVVLPKGILAMHMASRGYFTA